MTLKATMAADLAVFMNPDEFGSTALVGGVGVRGLFDRKYTETLETAGYAPVFTCAAADVSDIAQGDPLTIDGTAYTVVSVEPDGTGLVRLVLGEAA